MKREYDREAEPNVMVFSEEGSGYYIFIGDAKFYHHDKKLLEGLEALVSEKSRSDMASASEREARLREETAVARNEVTYLKRFLYQMITANQWTTDFKNEEKDLFSKLQ